MRLDHLADAVVRAVIPFQGGLRRLKRRLRPYEEDDANSDYCITNGLEQLAALRRLSIAVDGAEVLEFGVGWTPLIPLLFHMAGARRLVLTDVARLMDEHTLARAREIVAARVEDAARVLDRPAGDLLARLHGPFPHDYLVPWNPEAHPAGSVDIVISRAVLEHVPQPQIAVFFRQFHRILRERGVMCHVIDNSDHWQHKDRGLSRVEFLRYEETELVWRLAQMNEQAFQNRLRHSDYERMMRDAGFRVLLAEGEPDALCLRDLERIPLSSRFRGYAPRDLAILISLIVTTKV
ncbi:MAG: methyltransferase domain-containing protein [Acetobacteraceae bacterium]|nr:methyltransferase domain-containing protein [Acetobacteraceae bacterium]